VINSNNNQIDECLFTLFLHTILWLFAIKKINKPIIWPDNKIDLSREKATNPSYPTATYSKHIT